MGQRRVQTGSRQNARKLFPLGGSKNVRQNIFQFYHNNNAFIPNLVLNFWKSSLMVSLA
jgi:mRNA degradation ribonuclease J1/J2